MAHDRSRIADGLLRVQSAIAGACQRAGREPGSVRLVAVTKYVDEAAARLLVECGQADLGENRPQQLAARMEGLRDLRPRWHLIGHLQRNKVRLVVPGTDLIHSVDSLPLLQAISARADASSSTAHCLVEINPSGEPAKHGLAPEELLSFLEQADALPGISIDGLMAMSGLESSRDEARGQFEMVSRLAREHDANPVCRFRLRELSMGMSGDFEEAIAAGSTIVRIGSALFDAE